MDRKIIAICIGFAALFLTGAILTVVYFSVEPTLVLNGEDYLPCEVYSDYKDNGFSAKYLWMDLGKNVECISDVDTSRLGEYTVKYTMNYHGKEYSTVRTIQVVDTVAPVISILGNDTVSASSMDLYAEEGFLQPITMTVI